MSDIESTADVVAPPLEPVVPRFADFGLAEPIMRAIIDSGYTTPTPIQAQAIPLAMAGRDMMGAAQTGTGKTAAFSMPIIHRLMPFASTNVSPARHPVRALILTPPRELADQVAANVKAYSKDTPLRSTVVFGGVDMRPQTTALRGGVEIVIATPGRLLDHVEQKNINLSQVQILVLDEADRMLDMGFLPDLQRIVNLLPKQRQGLLFSATFSEEIKRLARTFLTDPTTIEVARRNSTNENVTQTLYAVAEEDKRATLVQILRSRELKQVIVFVNTKLGASRLARALERDDIKAVAIHGDRTQSERLKALDDFKALRIDVLVATDVAARGLDIADLPAVINYDIPTHAEDYVHRIGRTGRAGATGDAISLMAHDEERYVADIEKMIKRPMTREKLELHRAARSASSPSTSSSSSGERERAPRRETATAERAPRRDYSTDRPARAPAADPFFSKPYEPSPVSQAQAAEQPPVPQPSIRRSQAGKVGALLGGARKR
ncbi:DEAD/DEAH box helicase [soil metagenome]